MPTILSKNDWVRRVVKLDNSKSLYTCEECGGEGMTTCPYCGHETECTACGSEGMLSHPTTADYRNRKDLDLRMLDCFLNGTPLPEHIYSIYRALAACEPKGERGKPVKILLRLPLTGEVQTCLL